MADPQTNITEDGMPGDLSAAATDEFGGGAEASDEGGTMDVAADDAGTGALAGNTGRTAGGVADLGVGGQSGPGQDAPAGAPSIAADDAGAGRKAAEPAPDPANGSGAD